MLDGLLLLQLLGGPLLLLLGGLLGCLRSHTLACARLPARLAFVHPLWPQVAQKTWCCSATQAPYREGKLAAEREALSYPVRAPMSSGQNFPSDNLKRGYCIMPSRKQNMQ